MSAHFPAFPFQPIGSQGFPTHEGMEGLTKRELIAAMAMQGFAANPQGNDIARAAVRWADALLAELAKDGAK